MSKNHLQKQYIISLILTLDHEFESAPGRLKIYGIYAIHQKNCQNLECPCKLNNSKINSNFILENDEIFLILFYKIIQFLIQKQLKQHPKSTDLLLLSSQLHFYKQQKRYLALTELMKIEEYTDQFSTLFNIYLMKQNIENDMKFDDIKCKNEMQDTLDKILLFENQTEKLTKEINLSVNIFTDFWSELLETNSELKKLHSLGIQIIPQIKKVKQQYNKIIKMQFSLPRQLKIMELYAYYLKFIANDNNESIKILNRIQFLNFNSQNLKQQKQTKQYQKQSSKTQIQQQLLIKTEFTQEDLQNILVIQISANLKSFCRITSTNQEVVRILGYTKNEILGQNISCLMSKEFGEKHDDYIKNYINKTTNQQFSSQLIFPLDSYGYMVPSLSKAKILPNLNKGLQLISFTKEIEPIHCYPYNQINYQQRYTNHYIVYNTNDMLISCCTYSCYQFFGIRQELTNNNTPNASQFQIDMIIPELAQEKCLKQLQNNYKNQEDYNGVQMTLNTINLQNQFIISEQNIEIQQENTLDSSESEEIDQVSNSNQQATILPNNNSKNPAISYNINNQQKIKEKVKISQNKDKNQTPSSLINFNNLDQVLTQDNTILAQNNQSNNNITKQLKAIDKNINIDHKLYLKQKYKKTDIKVFLIQQIQGLYVLKFWDLNEPKKKDPALYEQENQEQQSDLIIKNKLQSMVLDKNNATNISNSSSENTSNNNNKIQKLQDNNIDSVENVIQPEYKQKSKLSQSTLKLRSVIQSKNNASSQNFQKFNQEDQKIINNSKEKSNSLEKKRKKEQRELKNIKQSLEQQHENTQIMRLFKGSVLIFLLIIAIITVQYQEKITEINDLEGSIEAVYTVFYRSTLIPRAGYYARSIYNDSNGYSYIAPIYLEDGITIDEEAMLQQKQGRLQNNQQTLKEISEEMHDYQFKVIEQLQFLNKIQNIKIKTIKDDIKFLQPDGSYVTDELEIQDAMLILISSMSALQQSTIYSLQDNGEGPYNDMQMYFNYLIDVGLFTIRQLNLQLSEEFENVYIQYTQSFEFISNILRWSCVGLLACFFLLLPFVWKSYQSKTELIVIFSLIKSKDLSQFLENCQKYQNIFLNDKTLLQMKNQQNNNNKKQQNNNNKNSITTVDDISQLNNEKQLQQQQQNLNEQSIQQLNFDQSRQELFPSMEESFSQQKQYQQRFQENIQQQENKNQQQIELQQITINNKQQSELNQNNQTNIEESEQNYFKQQKLLSQHRSNKFSLFIKLFLVFIILVGYFIMDHIIKQDFTKQIEVAIKHTELISSRQANLLYLLIFVREEMVTDEIKTDQQNYQNQQEFNEKQTLIYEFQELIYSSEQIIQNQLENDFSDSFKGYKDLANKYDTENPCILTQEAMKDDWFFPNLEICENLAEGAIKNGITQSITVLNEKTRSFIRKFREEKEQLGGQLTQQQKMGYVNHPYFIDLLYMYVAQRDSIQIIVEEFKENFLVYIQDQRQMQKLLYGSLVSFLVLIYFIFWLPFIYSLRKQLQITTQMVTLIPINIIHQNKYIKQGLTKMHIVRNIN